LFKKHQTCHKTERIEFQGISDKIILRQKETRRKSKKFCQAILQLKEKKETQTNINKMTDLEKEAI
jgi:hypothetical protein